MAYNPQFKINVAKVLSDTDFSDAQKDKLREFIVDQDFKTIFALRVIDKIVERTQVDRVDKKGQPLGVYSTSYRKSHIFKVYHGDEKEVNLTLTGEMLASLNPIYAKYEFIIELEGQNNRDKAQGHITGKYGKAKAQKRDFLGLPKAVIEEEFKLAMKEYRQSSLQELESLSAA